MPRPSVPRLEWEPFELFPACDLEARVEEAGFDDLEGFWCELLRLTITGEIPEGSAGRDALEWLRITTVAALIRSPPDVLLLDLSAATYRWGDGMLQVLQDVRGFDGRYPVRIVLLAGPGSHAGLASLLTPTGGSPPEDLFTDEEEALARAAVLASERSRAIG